MIAKISSSRVGVGLYTLAEAARLIGVPASTVRLWLKPVGGRLASDCGVIAFIELMELFFIRMLSDEGVSLECIRTISSAAAKRLNTDYPFNSKRFATEGKKIIETLIAAGENIEFLQDLRKARVAFAAQIKPFCRKLDYQEDERAARYWPMEKTGGIVLDPSRKFGEPIEAATGVPTRIIFDATLAGACGQDEATVAHWLGISQEAVAAAVSFERSLAK